MTTRLCGLFATTTSPGYIGHLGRQLLAPFQKTDVARPEILFRRRVSWQGIRRHQMYSGKRHDPQVIALCAAIEADDIAEMEC